MGMYATLRFETGTEDWFPDLDHSPSDITWKTDSFGRYPFGGDYKITDKGRLLKEDTEREFVDEEDRPHYDEETGGFDNAHDKLVGLVDKTTLGWKDVEYHGMIEFHGTVGNERVTFKAKFTDGDLVSISRLS